MSDLWKYLQNLNDEQMDEIITMTAAKIRQMATDENYEKPIRDLFKQLVEHKIDTNEIAINRSFMIDQGWIIQMVKKFIIRQNTNSEFGV